MGRIRTIKPEFPQSETIGRLSRDARLLFVQLWTFVDDSGRARASSRLLASALYPYDDDAPKLMDRWLAELEREGCIRRYTVEGNRYLDIPNWLKHQKIDRPSASRFPAFDEGSRALDEHSATDLGPRTSTKDLGPGPSTGDAGASRENVFENWFWKPYPRKVGKDAARKAWAQAVKRAPPETIIAALAGYRWPDDPQFIPHPATWLNQGRWSDEPTPETKVGVLNGNRHRRSAAQSPEDRDRAIRAEVFAGAYPGMAGDGRADFSGDGPSGGRDPAEAARVVGSGRA